jgi:hypothetical protein
MSTQVMLVALLLFIGGAIGWLLGKTFTVVHNFYGWVYLFFYLLTYPIRKWFS